MRVHWLSAAGLVSGLSLALHQYLVWIYAPVEQTMGLVQKIFYVHVPLAWWALVSFFLVCAAGIAYLARRSPFWDRLAWAAAETGVLFCGLSLVTGSLWARAAWNTWWTWDPRLTTALVLWFVYAGYLLLRVSDMSEERKTLVCSVLGIAAFADVPLVFYSARLWRSIHPAVLAAPGGGLDPEMRVTLLAGVAAWGMLWGVLLAIRLHQMLTQAKVDALAIRENP